MAVGNLVVGDSRVEKAAITARDLGYKVTVVGIRRRTVQQVSFIDGDIPVIRPPVGNEHHSRVADAIAKRQERLQERRRQINRLPQRLKRPAYIAHRIGVRSRDARVKASRRLGRSWRTLWPHLVDYEATFFDAFKALEPDLIHVHDRHPLPGAARYSLWANSTVGVRPVKWLYDAHEFVPTQHLPPPVEHEQAWIAVESECIKQADAVVTVTDKIAELIRQRHRLKSVPAVVRNLPSQKQAEQNSLHSDVRGELGLSPNIPLAVYAGGITPQRGLGTLLDAQQLIPELHVAVICKNDTQQRDVLREQSQKLGTEERLHFLDYVPSSHVSKFISTADIGISALLPSAAHQEAAPTKVSEYLHARLPVVVSDMRAQAERVRRLGFGTVYPSGNPTAMAEAITHVLGNVSEFKRHITKEVILKNSWEADAPVLEMIWQRLSPDDRELTFPSKPQPYLSLITSDHGVIRGWESAFDKIGERTRIRTTLPTINRMHGDLTDGRFILTDEGLRFLEFWRSEVSQLRGVFYDEPISLVDGWDPALTTGILTMSQKPAVRIIAGNSCIDVDRLREHYPYHWLHEVTETEDEAHRIRFTQIRESIRVNDRRVITNSLATAYSLGSMCIFVPCANTVSTPRTWAEDAPLRLGWAKGQRRSEAEKTALALLRATDAKELEIHELSDVEQSKTMQTVDIFIDSLSEDFPTGHGFKALAAGCVLVTGTSAGNARDEMGVASVGLVENIPAINTSPDNLGHVIDHLLNDRKVVCRLNAEAIEFSLREVAEESVATKLSSIN
nr:glycosyltransferase family 4 protein [Brevibacterium renqingii]